MENFTSCDRVVGSVDASEKEKILRKSASDFENQAFEELSDKEREKTPEELAIIDLANQVTNETRERYGIKSADIPPKNFHVILSDAWPKDSVAFYNSIKQAVAIREQTQKISFLNQIIHEMIHFKSYNALQVVTGNDPKLSEYRVGLTIHTRDGEKMFFKNLDEAVTEEMTKRLVLGLSMNSLFAEETRQTADVIQRYPDAVAADGKPLFDNDTYYAEVIDSKIEGATYDQSMDQQNRVKQIKTETFTYTKERKILNCLIDKLYSRNKEEFSTREEVFEVFSRSMMTGNILPLARLVEQTFGTGTMRQIGETDQDIETQEKIVNSL